MPKLLRPNEKITFVQTRAPTSMWRYVKSQAIQHATDGTATRLCTDNMLEFLKARHWERISWVRPKDLDGKKVGGSTGFQQVNLPLSNMDSAGEIIVSPTYLQEHGILNLFDSDKHAFREAVLTGEFSKLVYVAAKQLQVSGATFAYTFLFWLSVLKYTPTGAGAANPIEPAGTPFEREAPARRRTRPER